MSSPASATATAAVPPATSNVNAALAAIKTIFFAPGCRMRTNAGCTTLVHSRCPFARRKRSRKFVAYPGNAFAMNDQKEMQTSGSNHHAKLNGLIEKGDDGPRAVVDHESNIA